MISRRHFLGMAALGAPLALLSCGGSSAKVRFRVIAMADVDGRRVESSSVMEVDYSHVSHSLTGAGGSTRLYGEALIFDLGGRGTVFILPWEHDRKTVLIEIYPLAILRTFGVQNSVGTLEDQDFATLRKAKGRRRFSMGHGNPPTRLPAFAAFRDERVPNTVFEVDPQHMDQYFPGVRFVGLDIEITDAPVTQQLKQRLPWLVSPFKDPGFDRDPIQHTRDMKDQPLGYKLTYSYFFGDGSQ